MTLESLLEHIIHTPYGTIWRENPDNAREIMDQFPDFTFSHVEWMSYTWPGCYPVYYICKDGSDFCHKCANANFKYTVDPDSDWLIVAGDINYEDHELWCVNCNEQIESAYGEEQDDFDDIMDGDADSALANADFGTDEDYGGQTD